MSSEFAPPATPHVRKYRWTDEYRINRPASELKAAVHQILTAHELLDTFEASEVFLVRLEIRGALPLTIRRFGREITIAHYFDLGGDQEADPGMDLELSRDGAWYPTAGYFEDIYSCMDGPLDVNFEKRRKLSAFGAKWATDLLTIGYQHGEIADLWGETVSDDFTTVIVDSEGMKK